MKLFFFFFLLSRPAEQFCSWWICVFICAAGGLCEQDGGWRGDRYGVGPGGDTLPHQPWAHRITPLHWSPGPRRVPHHHRSAHTHTCTGVETVHSSLPSALHTLTHPCLIDVSHHWSILFLPSGCSNTCFLKSVKIFLNLDEPVAHYIIGWHGNHEEFNDSTSLAHGFLTFSFQGPPKIMMLFLRGTSFRKYWQLHLYCVI